MAKDSYYFPHEYNARHDPKCEEIDIDFGNRGYGIFWKLVEIFNEQNNRVPVARLKALAHEIREPEADILRILDGYDLFQRIIENGTEFFTSRSIQKRLDHRDSVLNQKREAGRKSAAVRKANAERNKNSIQTDTTQKMNGCSTDVQTDVQQGNKIKENKEPKGSIKEKINKKEIDLSFVQEELKESFSAYLRMRKEIKRPAKTAKAIRDRYNDLARLSGGDIELALKIIEQTISHEWTDFYELKTNSNGRSNRQTDSRCKDGYQPDYSKTTF